jgi:hypothetical protein
MDIDQEKAPKEATSGQSAATENIKALSALSAVSIPGRFISGFV